MVKGGDGVTIGAARSVSIRGRLVRLVLVLFVPALLLTAGLIWSLERQASRTQERQLAATARTLALVVDSRIGEQVATLNALSVSRPLAQGDFAAFAEQARSALQSTEGWVVVRQPGGPQLVNTHAGKNDPALASKMALEGVSWAGKRNDVWVSNLVWGALAQEYVVVVMKPVTLQDGRTVNLNVVLPAQTFTQLVARQDLPGRWTATIIDGRRIVVGRNRGSDRFIGRQASPDMVTAFAARQSGLVRSRTFEGIAVITAFDQLPQYGWGAIVAVPREEALGADESTVILALIAGVLMLTIAVLLALRIGQQIARPVERVADAAAAWEAGRAADFPTETGLAETDDLSRAFASALATVRHRDERQKLLINELNHRVKNTLATVQAVAQHTRKGSKSVDAYHAALEGRVIAMSRAHELLTRSAWDGAELGELAHQALSAFVGPQLKIEGPTLQVGPTDALNLTLVLYELATNASKHGALSTGEGRVQLSWRREGDETRVSWRESGGPVVAAPKHNGFGSRLIARATRDLQPSSFRFEPGGVSCDFTVRAEMFQVRRRVDLER